MWFLRVSVLLCQRLVGGIGSKHTLSKQMYDARTYKPPVVKTLAKPVAHIRSCISFVNACLRLHNFGSRAGSCERVRPNQTSENPHAHACGSPTHFVRVQTSGEPFASASGFARTSTTEPIEREPACSRMRLANTLRQRTGSGSGAGSTLLKC